MVHSGQKQQDHGSGSRSRAQHSTAQHSSSSSSIALCGNCSRHRWQSRIQTATDHLPRHRMPTVVTIV
jgi:hypothetical protein